MKISLNLNDEDSKLIQAYASNHGISVSELLRNSVLERIEDEHDRKVYEESYKEYIDSGKVSAPIENLWQELGL
jgi:hypothetical protein